MRTSFVTWTGSDGFGIPGVQRGSVCSCAHSPTAATCFPGIGSIRNWEAAPKLNLLFYFTVRTQTGKIKKGRRGESAEHREPPEGSNAMELLCKAKWTSWEELSWPVEQEGIPVWWKWHMEVWWGQSHVPSSAPHVGVCARVMPVTARVSPDTATRSDPGGTGSIWHCSFNLSGQAMHFPVTVTGQMVLVGGFELHQSSVSKEWGEPRHRPWNELEHAIIYS